MEINASRLTQYEDRRQTLGELIAGLQKFDPETTVSASVADTTQRVRTGLEGGILHNFHIVIDFEYIEKLVSKADGGEL